MGTVTDVAQLNGLFKEIYADRVENLIPDISVIQKMVGFNDSTKIGNSYNQPVKLTASQGVTYAGADSGAFALNKSVALTTRNAVVRGSQMVLRDQMSYEAAAKSSHGGKASFVEGTRFLVDCMVETMSKRLEIGMVYGSTGLGIPLTSTNVNATSTTLNFGADEWAVGIWSGLENAIMNFYAGNVLPAIGGTAVDDDFIVAAMDVDARTVTVTGTAAGITALDLAITAGPVNVYFKGAFGSEMAGLDSIITNTGTLFNINASTYNLWKGNVYPAGGTALSLNHIYKAVGRAVGRGLNEDVTCFVNPDTWKDLGTDLAAQRYLDSSYSASQNKNGQESIVYYGANGKIDIVSHNVVKGGEAFIVPIKRCKRIGASDIRFKPLGGSNQERFFLEMADAAGYELRAYSDQAIFLETPAKAVKITGIVNK